MKNLTKCLLAVVMIAVVLTSSVVNSSASEQRISTTTSISPLTFNRIWVSGKVKIILTQGDQPTVEGVNNFDPSTTSVMTNGQTLFIKSSEIGLVTLHVIVKDLQRVEAFGDAIVVTSNKFDVKNLQVFLHENAYAKIKTTTQSLYTIVEDNAVLKLNGTADQSTMLAKNIKNLKLGDFASLKSQPSVKE